MNRDDMLDIPVGVSLTHDKGQPVIFAYVGGKGRLGMRAKRFNPRILGGLDRALKQAVRWRKQALREHMAAMAALTALPKRKRAKRLPVGGDADRRNQPEPFSVEVRFVSGGRRRTR